jgi:hypothetical protein
MPLEDSLTSATAEPERRFKPGAQIGSVPDWAASRTFGLP